MLCKWSVVHRIISSCGIPRGSILELILFITYLNDFPKCLQHTTPGMFADDTYISTAHEDYPQLNVP